MAKWTKVHTLMRNTHSEEEAARLGLDLQSDTIIRPVMIDLDRVETYSCMYDNDGEEVSDESVVVLYSGNELAIKMPFSILDQIIRGNGPKKEKTTSRVSDL